MDVGASKRRRIRRRSVRKGHTELDHVLAGKQQKRNISATLLSSFRVRREYLVSSMENAGAALAPRAAVMTVNRFVVP